MIKKIIIFLWGLLIINSLYADDVLIDVTPQEPILNESFFVTFHVKASSEGDPYISFTPQGVSVMGKREQGVSISTVMINGKFTTTKEQNIVYELMADRAGQAYLKNIKVELNGKTTAVKDVAISILSAPKRVPEAFIEAQVSKIRAFVGEGIDVNYYLYFKTTIQANDVKEFPKLNKFIKRFHHINSPVETVQYKGQVMRRILAYSARIYPEKPGTAVVDPMKISVQVVENDHSGFGFGGQQLKNKDLSSNRVEVEVSALPIENVPPGFTGLVGEHEFKLSGGRTKYLVNEPIEFKLEVKGVGALEKMEAPSLFVDNNLETFDTKAEVTEDGVSRARKVFDYTYLARNALTLKGRDLELAYFDPNSKQYIVKKISLPGLLVEGGQFQKPSENQNQNLKPEEKKVSMPELNFNFFKSSVGVNGLVGPYFVSPSFFKIYFYRVFALVFLLLSLLVIGAMVLDEKNGEETIITFNAEAKAIYKQIKSKGVTHSLLYKFLVFLDKKNVMAQGHSLYDVLDSSHLSIDAKNYFKNQLLKLEKKVYSHEKTSDEIKFEGKYFNEVLKKV